MPMILRSTFLLIALLAFAHCKKKPLKSPENPGSSATHFFKCDLNGSEWIASVPPSIGGPASLQAEYTESSGDITFMAIRKTQDQSVYEGVTLAVSGVYGLGTYELYTGDGDYDGFYDLADNHPCGIYYHDPATPGQLTVTTYDTIQQLIKGTFYVTLKNPGCGPDSLMTLSDGTFAFRY